MPDNIPPHRTQITLKRPKNYELLIFIVSQSFVVPHRSVISRDGLPRVSVLPVHRTAKASQCYQCVTRGTFGAMLTVSIGTECRSITRYSIGGISIIYFQQHHEGVTTGHNRMTEWMEAYAEAHNPHESADSRIVYLIIM